MSSSSFLSCAHIPCTQQQHNTHTRPCIVLGIIRLYSVFLCPVRIFSTVPKDVRKAYDPRSARRKDMAGTVTGYFTIASTALHGKSSLPSTRTHLLFCTKRRQSVVCSVSSAPWRLSTDGYWSWQWSCWAPLVGWPQGQTHFFHSGVRPDTVYGPGPR